MCRASCNKICPWWILWGIRDKSESTKARVIKALKKEGKIYDERQDLRINGRKGIKW